MNSVCVYQTSGMVSRAGASLPQMPGGFWCLPAPLPAHFSLCDGDYPQRRRCLIAENETSEG